MLSGVSEVKHIVLVRIVLYNRVKGGQLSIPLCVPPQDREDRDKEGSGTPLGLSKQSVRCVLALIDYPLRFRYARLRSFFACLSSGVIFASFSFLAAVHSALYCACCSANSVSDKI